MSDMKELMEVYQQSIRQLEKRHKELVEKTSLYDKRVALLEEEIDELYEAMSMMRRHMVS